MPETELTKLRRARSRCHLQLKNSEALVAGYQAKLVDLEARIRAIAPELDLPRRFRNPNPIFARGEMTRVALTVLREAGEPLPIRVIAVRALALKGIDLPGPTLRHAIRKRLRMALIALDKRGVTMCVGSGKDTRRTLAEQ